MDVRVLDAQIGNESARELGPLKYMAELTGQPMSKIVNWFMMLIIFVFDPLAIAMVVAANMAFANIKGVARDPKDYEVYQPKVITKEVIKEVPVEVEKIIEVEKIVEVPVEKEVIIERQVEAKKIPNHLKGPIMEAMKHARRRGEDISGLHDGLFED